MGRLGKGLASTCMHCATPWRARPTSEKSLPRQPAGGVPCDVAAQAQPRQGGQGHESAGKAGRRGGGQAKRSSKPTGAGAKQKGTCLHTHTNIISCASPLATKHAAMPHSRRCCNARRAAAAAADGAPAATAVAPGAASCAAVPNRLPRRRAMRWLLLLPAPVSPPSPPVGEDGCSGDPGDNLSCAPPKKLRSTTAS